MYEIGNGNQASPYLLNLETLGAGVYLVQVRNTLGAMRMTKIVKE
ncbi:MAG: hypothetical protein RLZZ628_628 [Bacteroidota bacterium]